MPEYVRKTYSLRADQVASLEQLKIARYGNASLRLESEIVRQAIDEYLEHHPSTPSTMKEEYRS